jgi:hypothetical protein
MATIRADGNDASLPLTAGEAGQKLQEGVAGGFDGLNRYIQDGPAGVSVRNY